MSNEVAKVTINGLVYNEKETVGSHIIGSFAYISGSTYGQVDAMTDKQKQRIQYAINSITTYATADVKGRDTMKLAFMQGDPTLLATTVAPIVSGFDIGTDFDILPFKGKGGSSFVLAYTQVGWGKVFDKYAKDYVKVLGGEVVIEGEKYASQFGVAPKHIKNPNREVTWDNIVLAYQVVRIGQDLVTVELYKKELDAIKKVGSDIGIHKQWARKFALAKAMKEVYYTLKRGGHLSIPDVLTRILESDENVVTPNHLKTGVRDASAYDNNSLSMKEVRELLEEELVQDQAKVIKIIKDNGWAFDQLTKAQIETIKEKFRNE